MSHLGRLEDLIDLRAAAHWHRDEMQRDGDARHVEAAEMLERLSLELPGLQDSELHRRLYELWRRDPDDFNRELAQFLRDIGFELHPGSLRDWLFMIERILSIGERR